MKNDKILGALAITSLAFAGVANANKHNKAPAPGAHPTSKWVCKNGCKAHGTCKTAANACKGKNGCAGKGGNIEASDAKACEKAHGKWTEETSV